MHKKFKDCKLKGLILSTIRSGKNTGKTIYPAIQFPHHIDSLYTELNFLRRYGYITARKTGRTSTYSLTKKGYAHALNPDVFKIEKHNRFNKSVNGAVETILTNDEKFMNAVKKYAHEHFERPVIEQINKSPDIIGGGHTEFIDVPAVSTNKDNPAITTAKPQKQKPQSAFDKKFDDFKKSMEEIKQRNKKKDEEIERLKKEYAKEELEKKGNAINEPKYDPLQDIQDPNILKDKIKELEKSNEFLANERKNLQNQLMAKSPVFDQSQNAPSNASPASFQPQQYQSADYIGDDGKLHKRKVKIPNPPTEDEIQRKNRRKPLANQYKNYTLDKDFFAQWANGNLRPVLLVKDKQGKQKLDIISVNNTVSRQKLVKLDYYAENRIGELELYIEYIHATGITIRSYRYANWRKVLDW